MATFEEAMGWTRMTLDELREQAAREGRAIAEAEQELQDAQADFEALSAFIARREAGAVPVVPTAVPLASDFTIF